MHSATLQQTGQCVPSRSESIAPFTYAGPVVVACHRDTCRLAQLELRPLPALRTVAYHRLWPVWLVIASKCISSFPSMAVGAVSANCCAPCVPAMPSAYCARTAQAAHGQADRSWDDGARHAARGHGVEPRDRPGRPDLGRRGAECHQREVGDRRVPEANDSSPPRAVNLHVDLRGNLLDCTCVSRDRG